MGMNGSTSFILKQLFCEKQNLDSLINNVGMYPDKIEETIEELEIANLVCKKDDLFELTEKGRLMCSDYPFAQFDLNHYFADAIFEKLYEQMPKEHPQQYQYWFTPETCKNIAKVFIDTVVIESPKIAFIGTPTLAIYFNKLFPSYDLLFIDISRTIIEYVSDNTNDYMTVVERDLRKDKLDQIKKHYDMIIIDPPFYYDYYKLFIEAASYLQNNEAYLFSVIYGNHIKDNSLEKRCIFESFSKYYAFYGSYDNILHYKCPDFEKNTFRSAKLKYKNIKDWRHNTLAVFKKCYLPMENIIYSDNCPWDEFFINNKRIMVKIPEIDTDAWMLKPLYNDSNILKSVSRRCTDREKIGIWTSDNEVYEASSEALVAFRRFLSLLQADSHSSFKIIEKLYGENKFNEIMQVAKEIKLIND